MSLKAIVLMSALFVVGELAFRSGNGDPGATDFTYNIHPSDPLGVYNWHLSYPDYCAGHQQSPVDIKTNYARFNRTLQCPTVTFLTDPVPGYLKNTGHSVTFTPQDPNAMSVTNIPYRPGKYLLNDVYIRYGGVYGRGGGTQPTPGFLYPGAEHTLNGYRYDGELQFVFKNSQPESEYGPVIGAFFVRVVPDHHVQDMGFSTFLEEHISSVSAINQTELISADQAMMFGVNCNYYTYTGSETTPFCRESIRWYISRDPINVTQSAWYELSQVESRGNFVSLYGNYRNEQRLNLRTIETNIYTPPPPPPIVD